MGSFHLTQPANGKVSLGLSSEYSILFISRTTGVGTLGWAKVIHSRESRKAQGLKEREREPNRIQVSEWKLAVDTQGVIESPTWLSLEAVS